MDAITAYAATTRCRDLPELMDRSSGELVLALPAGDLERVVAAVAARRSPGAALQEKIDGCWCAMQIDADARVESVTSRSGKPLRVAVAWVGVQMHRNLRGWTLVGEIEAGTSWASRRRAPGELPRFHVYGALDRAGRVVDRHRLARSAIARFRPHPDRHGHESQQPVCQLVREARHGEDWATFVRSVLEAGGEGVVIHEDGGARWRAKTRLTVDRVVLRVERRRDRNGDMRHHALVGLVGREIQDVLVPEWADADDLEGRVVAVTGASLDETAGVVRHARIVEVREDGDKLPDDCTIAA